MTENAEKIYQNTSGGFGAIASAFVIESLQHMISWLIVMFALILADLLSGLFKSYKIGEKIRPSRMLRDTIAKAVTYFAFVVCACMVGVATEGDGNLEKYCCLFVILIEGLSICGNILRFNGYILDFNKTIAFIISKKFECDKEEIQELVKNAKTDGKNKSRNGRTDKES